MKDIDPKATCGCGFKLAYTGAAKYSDPLQYEYQCISILCKRTIYLSQAIHDLLSSKENIVES